MRTVSLVLQETVTQRILQSIPRKKPFFHKPRVRWYNAGRIPQSLDIGTRTHYMLDASKRADLALVEDLIAIDRDSVNRTIW
jgi:hypothetical protein